MPWLPFGLRDWFNDLFEDLCRKHDADYYDGRCKICSDVDLVKGIWDRGYWWLVPFVFIAVNLPWVWGWWIWNYLRLST